MILPFTLFLASVAAQASVSGQQYILSPSSRSVQPRAVYRTTGNVTTGGGDATTTSDVSAGFRLTGPGSSLTLDFGQITAGVPNLQFGDVNLAYTEAVDFVGIASDNSTRNTHLDGTLYVPITANEAYSVPPAWNRGAFRHLTLSIPESASQEQAVEVSLTSLTYTAQPSAENPAEYAGYFECSDDLLNRIWYAGAYTVQLCTVSANSSIDHIRVLDPVGWSADAQTVGLNASDEFLSDGAKRDRNPWAGDLGVSTRSGLSLEKDLITTRNSLIGMFVVQNATTGYFAYCGSPLGELFGLVGTAYDSDTYHLWTIIGYGEYVLSSRDRSFGEQYWGNITAGLAAVETYLDPTTGLLNGTGGLDCGRVGQFGQSTSLNALYCYALNTSAQVATYIERAENATAWEQKATAIKTAVNDNLYDSSAGLYWDNTTDAGHSVYPQDGNTFAILFNVTSSAEQALTVANSLAARLTDNGTPAPELPGFISPFISSLELFAQIAASPADASRALALTRTQWAFMMNRFSNSTFIEGYALDGSLDYGFYAGGSAFISHVHAWSTGPMYLLSSLIGGMRAATFDVPASDGDWVFQPVVNGSGLTEAKAGFVRPVGTFNSSWAVEENRFTAKFSVPNGQIGTVYLPAFDGASDYTLDEVSVNDGDRITLGGFIRVANVSRGEH
ncbi:Putative six-hairpin glycosidase superfamily, alpha-L-rhamnosidase, six-hairpin glycosidase [Septoria linicola]|uniref:Six-hairpin glycosidase superfamily, alpha-L-rhamnosidase, six-hairpin glycosidase n=1 Tax=Septoria linicola TaxID=215465 RepID=A0A9Q9AUU5_9PEZI|nr:putative six-hairpin glycosidase superfamily, alpha-L-rhamnosidase, six-hairpin glycosidase [Septoria linicola]USW56287.1 Putative six-hairpin glycosidase superfamily, alpha-L-rhamnosidase, six-hairpin glycosidase [Septoria linicola]